MFSEYFIDRPRFAGVISVIMILLGLLAIAVLPVSQYPQITPPQIVVSTTYPGASAQVLVDTVAVPIENQINGVENMLYMSSSSDDNGSYSLTITFDVGTDPDIAQVKVQNRLSQVMSQLPALVQQEGIDVKTQMSNILGLLVLRSPNNTYNDLYLSNFAYTDIQNPLARVDGVRLWTAVQYARLAQQRPAFFARPEQYGYRQRYFLAEYSGIGRPNRRRAERPRYGAGSVSDRQGAA